MRRQTKALNLKTLFKKKAGSRYCFLEKYLYFQSSEFKKLNHFAIDAC
jgi:hypothetical protein